MEALGGECECGRAKMNGDWIGSLPGSKKNAVRAREARSGGEIGDEADAAMGVSSL